MSSTAYQSIGAVIRQSAIQLDEPIDWPDGTRVIVLPIGSTSTAKRLDGHAIVVGFGLAGRCVASLLTQAGIPYTIVEKNPVTVATQRSLGHQIVEGDIRDTQTLIEAGLHTAAMLALTIPDEQAVLSATTLARRLRPKMYIIARTNFSSQGMKVSQLGADDVIKAEQAVALQFYDRLARHLYTAEKSADNASTAT